MEWCKLYHFIFICASPLSMNQTVIYNVFVVNIITTQHKFDVLHLHILYSEVHENENDVVRTM